MLNFHGEIKMRKPRTFMVSAVTSRLCDPESFCVDILGKFGVGSVKSVDGGTSVDPSELACKWNIAESLARLTIQATTRLCPRNDSTITLNQRYAYNDRMIRYKHLPCNSHV